MTRILVIGVALVVAASVNAASPREPGPLRGAPLGADTDLRLLVSDNQPFVLDVDAGTVTRVRAIPRLNRGVLRVVGVGGRGAVVVAQSAVDATLYGVRGSAARVSRLGRGRDVVPDGRGGVWIKSARGRRGCVLRHVSLGGRALGAARAFPCRSTIYPGGKLGVVVNRTRLVDARGRTIRRTRWGVVAAAGAKLVLYGGARRLALLDVATGKERRLEWPSVLSGLDAPAVDPLGRYVALGFANPAWAGGSQQAADVWLLDTRTERLTQVPGMPAFVSLKRTSMEWTDDGRLVLLAQADDGDVVVAWRPGERRLSLKTVRLPRGRSGSSDSFALLH